MTTTPQLPFSCIKQSTRLGQAKRTLRIAVLVIKRSAAATLQARRHRGHAIRLCSVSPPSWMDGGFFCQDDVLSAMDRIHGHSRHRALCSTFATMWIALPACSFRGRGPRQYIRRQRTTKGGIPHSPAHSTHEQLRLKEKTELVPP